MSPPFDERALRQGYADLSEVRLHYVEAGEGPLVVLLHGFPDFWFGWRNQLLALAQAGLRVVAPDLRGYNLSDRPRRVSAYGAAHLTRDVAELVGFLGERRATLVGHDWGALIAWSTAMQHPHLVERLVALNGPHPRRLAQALTTPAQLKKSWYILPLQLRLLPELAFSAFGHALLRRVLTQGLARPSSINEDDMQRYLEAFGRPGALAAALNYFRAGIPGLFFGKQHGPLAAPALVVFGDCDPYLELDVACPRPEWATNVQLERVPDAGHWVHVDAPGRVNTLLIGFCLGRAAA